MSNLLENWKQECYVLSSPLAVKKTLDRADVDRIHDRLTSFFGLAYFNVEKNDFSGKSNWLHFLLINHKRPACIAALYEIANILDYHKSLSKSIQKRFKSLFSDPRQLRDVFFELYTYRLLDYNKLPNTKNPKDGRQELEATCTINQKVWLIECRKVYIPGVEKLNTQRGLLERLTLKLKSLNKGLGFIGKVKFHNLNDRNIISLFEEKLDKFINRFNSEKFHTVDYHDIDKSGKLSVIDYSEVNDVEIEKDLLCYDIIFKVIPPINPVQGILNRYTVEIKAAASILQYEINRKVFTVLQEKSLQHACSQFSNKIYFFDSEIIPDLELAIFHSDSMFEEEEIQKYVESNFSDGEVFCFIRREYMNYAPTVKIKAYGKNIDKEVKKCLESLRTNFDYKIELV